LGQAGRSLSTLGGHSNEEAGRRLTVRRRGLPGAHAPHARDQARRRTLVRPEVQLFLNQDRAMLHRMLLAWVVRIALNQAGKDINTDYAERRLSHGLHGKADSGATRKQGQWSNAARSAITLTFFPCNPCLCPRFYFAAAAGCRQAHATAKNGTPGAFAPSSASQARIFTTKARRHEGGIFGQSCGGPSCGRARSHAARGTQTHPSCLRGENPCLLVDHKRPRGRSSDRQPSASRRARRAAMARRMWSCTRLRISTTPSGATR
jgi:hypothetical protein